MDLVARGGRRERVSHAEGARMGVRVPDKVLGRAACDVAPVVPAVGGVLEVDRPRRPGRGCPSRASRSTRSRRGRPACPDTEVSGVAVSEVVVAAVVDRLGRDSARSKD